MLGFGILSGLLVLPLAGAAFILTLRGDEEAVRSNARWAALAATVVTFLLSVVAWSRFDTGSATFQLLESHAWLAETIRFKLGVDGFSMPFILLTTFLMPFCILASWDSIEHRVKEYMVAFLVLETTMIGVFAALDLVLFYLFFEAGLIPMFLIIGIWGGRRRIYASFKFFLYTLLGSILMLLAIMAMYWAAGTTDIPTLLGSSGSPRTCRPGCGSPSSPPSRSRCRCGRSTPGCPTRTSRRRPRGRSCSPPSSSRWAATASSGSPSRCSRRRRRTLRRWSSRCR